MTNQRIYKYIYPLIEDPKRIKMPRGSSILGVEEQFGNIVVYALIDKDEQTIIDYPIAVLGTGRRVPSDINDYAFLGTVKLFGGELMFHVFCKKTDKHPS